MFFSCSKYVSSVVNGDTEKTVLQVKTYIIMYVITSVRPRFRPLNVCN